MIFRFSLSGDVSGVRLELNRIVFPIPTKPALLPAEGPELSRRELPLMRRTLILGASLAGGAGAANFCSTQVMLAS